jgi:hypothetical protein
MRRLLGLLLVAYSLVLALNTTIPLVGEAIGNDVTVSTSGDSFECSLPLGRPPFAGLSGNCRASWQSGGTPVIGTVYGAAAQDLRTPVTAVQLPIGMYYAYMPLSTGAEKAGALVAVPLLILGLVLLLKPKKRRRRSGHSHDHDDDYDDDSDSDADSDGGDSGGDGGD